MNTPSALPCPRVLVVLDDTVEGATVIEWSAALARSLQRDLAVVYVESTPALVAAALPFTQVLAHAGAQWAPFTPQDVERGYRAQAEQLRVLADRITLRHAVHWSMRTVRGAMPHTAFELLAQDDLLFVASSAATRPPSAGRMPPKPARAPRLTVATDDSADSARGLAVATQLAHSLSASLQVLHMAPGTDPGDDALWLVSARQADLLVLPRALATPRGLARLSRPTLLVA